MIFTELKKEYIKQMVEIEKLCFSEPWSEKSLEEELENNFAKYSVAVSDGIVLGYVGCHIILDEGYITNVAVHPKYRRQGLGNSIIKNMLISLCKLSFVTLEVRESNIAAINLYSNNGFVKVGKRPNFYDKPKENAILMTYKTEDI